MTPSSSFQLLKRLGSAPLDPLVEALRDLHQRGSADSKQLQELLSGGDVQLPAAESTIPAMARAPRANSANYESARRHFVEHAQRLREQAILTERLLDGLSGHHGAAAAALPVRELNVPCARGGEASVCFALVNTFDHAIDVQFRTKHGNTPLPIPVNDVMSFQPPNPRLEPGQDEIVRLSVDVRQWTPAVPAFDIVVDVLGNERLLLRLVVRVQIVGEEEA